ncbi:MAG: LysM peptidoglycan-binding domain-containing protein [Flavobacterium sp.]
MIRFVLVCLFVIFSFGLIAQNNANFQEHLVKEGETITSIATQYRVTPADLYQYNPYAKKGLKLGSKLIIPKKSNGNVATNADTHIVEAQETWFGIAKKYGLTIEALQQANKEAMEKGLQIGTTLQIPKASKQSANVSSEKKPLQTNAHEATHTVQQKETKYSIAKQYNLTVEQLEAWNPEYKDNLPLGAVLKLSGKPNNETSNKNTILKTSASNSIVVEKGQTLYSIAKQYQIEVSDLQEWNPELKDGLKEGMTLQLKSKVLNTNGNSTLPKVVKQISLNQSSQKKIALLLPFQLSKLDGATSANTQARLKNDEFFNMTLDFYTGAKMAVDSIKKIHPNLSVTWLDSEETSKTSAIDKLIAEEDLVSYDVIVGPFYPQHIENLMQQVAQETVVISPLREVLKNYPNLVQSMPGGSEQKKTLLDYLQTKTSNQVAVIDAKKQFSSNYLQKFYPKVGVVKANEKNVVTIEDIRSKMVKGKTNALLLDSANTNLVLSTIGALSVLKSEGFEIVFAMMEYNETIVSDDVFSRIIKHQVIFPSVVKNVDAQDIIYFEKKFKSLFKMFPTPFAMRGFDVTIDVLQRSLEEKPFLESIKSKTQQVENKFWYEKNDANGYTNQGVYLLQYQPNYQIQVLN